MSVRRLDPSQPASFTFSADNEAWARATIAKFPEGKQASAVIGLLWRAQEQSGGWLPEPAIRTVGEMLDMAHIRVLEVATFYTMFQLSPVGKKAHIQVCGTTPCMLRGSEALIEACKKRINEQPHKLSPDGNFSWEEVECLGACVNAPLIQVGNKLYEDLTPETLGDVMDAFARGETPEAGPRIERDFSAPIGGATTLNQPGFYEELAVRFADTGNSAGAEPVASPPDENKSNAGPAAALNEAVKVTGPDTARGASSIAAGAATAALTLAGTDASATSAADEADEAGKPAALAGPRGGQADDLKRISGVGPKIEGILNELGIFHFDQVANWSRETTQWVDNYLSFKGRIDREDWIAQARKLAAE